MSLIDVGANLTHESFKDDLEAVLERSFSMGVRQIVVTGADREGNQRAQTLAAMRPGVLWATAGNHPHYAADYDASLHAQIHDLGAANRVVAIGETGLDYFRDLAPRPTQLKCFEAQLDIAAALKLPVFMHQRDAHADFLAVLKERRAELGAAVVHCFTDTGEALDDYLELDLHVGITGWICDERRGGHLGELVGRIPSNRLMIETDAPYLMPRDIRPKPKSRRNEPMHLRHICEAVAAFRGESPETTAGSTAATARAFFNLPAVKVSQAR